MTVNLNNFVEVELLKDFLIVKETLTRIGVSPKHAEEKKLFQSVHLLHKRGKYYLAHFLQLFELDGKSSSFSENDQARLNTIAAYLEQWGLVKVVHPEQIEEPRVPLSKIKIVSFKEKDDYQLIAKYTLGKKRAA